MLLSEVVKLDSKGRVTIPAAMRLALGLEVGDRVLLVMDPERMSIEIRFLKDVESCSIEIEKDRFVELVQSFLKDIYALSCVDREGIMRCRFLASAGVCAEMVQTVGSRHDSTRDLHRGREEDNELRRLHSDIGMPW